MLAHTAWVLLALVLGLLPHTGHADVPPAAAQAGFVCTVPQGTLRGELDRGRSLHAEHCAACHGLTGAADVVVMHMDLMPGDHSDPDFMRRLSDPYLYLAICGGGPAIGKSWVMSAWGDILTDQDIRDLIAWIRSLSGT